MRKTVEQFFIIQCYETDNQGVFRLTGYTLHSSLPHKKFVELLEIIEDELWWYIDRIKLIQCLIFQGRDEIFEREVISFTKGDTEIQVHNVVPELVEFFRQNTTIPFPAVKVDSITNSYVGAVVRKKGEQEEKLILEQNKLRVWFRENYTTIQQLRKEYEIKNEKGEWTDL